MKEIILDSKQFDNTVNKLIENIFSYHKDFDKTAIIGIHTNGVYLAKKIATAIGKKIKKEIPVGTIDITLYRDDIDDLGTDFPEIKDSIIPFDISKKNIILVDDVLYTGRTIRAALDVIMDFGRPNKIELAVLIDRGNRELPIEANFVGFKKEINSKVKVECEDSCGQNRVFTFNPSTE
ncbi:MAG: bifunctional pyr operon transcriptional regulator/uracil phosphoribosyltransferase PyrR [Elusimicrobiota bacterium]|jgi:pyrimidine operon attenuation protein/uracil phosphoribosyltransferase|nr:bifunctional pyr operon transcriptional regulator/uracil phosphoribosyltransferase PyrR [Elusimicrobiota bacterium]